MRAGRARAHLQAIAARPRPAGGPAEAAARAYAADVLRRADFAVREVPFAYSAAVGRWGTPLGGLASMAALAGAAWLGAHGRGAAALGLLLGAASALGALGAWAARRGVLRVPVLRAAGVNLVATRGGAEPQHWLVAHLDSKSQPVPIGLRAAGVTGSLLAWLLLLALALLGGAPALWWGAAALGIAAGVPVAASVVTARSPGALDDASGVAAVLLAAEDAPPDAPLGVLLTSAEELGLAGARAWAATRPPGGVALNVDGVDDTGRITAMTGVRAPAALVGALRDAAAALGVPLGVRRLVPGILVDAVALDDAGWATLTLSRGSWRTLARIHTPSDTLDRLDGTGVAEVARLLVATLARLR